MTTSPISRVAAYTAAAQREPILAGVDIIDTALDAAGRRVELRVADLAAVLAIHEEYCPHVEHCERCNTVLDAEHGIGEAADCPADQVHCTSPWCWDEACMDAHRDDQAADAAHDEEVGCP